MIRSLYLARHRVPNLVVAQRVLARMAAAAQHFIEDETGEALVGLVVPGERTNGVPTIYVLDTIAPDESAVRQLHTFQQGDARQDEIIWWLQENWRLYRQRRQTSFGGALQAKWDVPLRYLGDWHKQPGYMIQPSTGDQMTALNWLDDADNGMDFLLAPILTLGHPSTISEGAPGANFVTMPHTEDTHIRVDFWYIDRTLRLFQPIAPAIYPDDQLPGLPAYPWHLTDTARFDEEHRLMQRDGLALTVVLWNATDPPPLEVCFLTARVGADRVLIVITGWDYPQRPPAARVAPFRHMGPDDDLYGVFAQLWAESQPVSDPPGWAWTPDKRLLDYIHAVETSLGLRPAAPPPRTSEAAETDAPSGGQP